MRKNANTTIDEELYKKLKILAIKIDKNYNELIEEGIKMVLDIYEQKDGDK